MPPPLFYCQMLKEKFRFVAFLFTQLSSLPPSPTSPLLAPWLPSSSCSYYCSLGWWSNILCTVSAGEAWQSPWTPPSLSFCATLWVPLILPSVPFSSLHIPSLCSFLKTLSFSFFLFYNISAVGVYNHFLYTGAPDIIFPALTFPWAPDCIAIWFSKSEILQNWFILGIMRLPSL